ncbi:unnamed protein product, partial [Mesorhabditis belari]|uniref:Uncharacterized protein n=1 Tax=Mesorhabditis belari TaxID=2138241 RepID=A0AAF3F5Y2_9BILA
MSADFGLNTDSVAIGLFFGFSTLATVTNFVASLIVFRNSRLHKVVKMYFLGSHLARIICSLCGFVFAGCSNK